MKKNNRKISYLQYRQMIDSNKSLRHAVHTLRGQVQEMKHYWKIRCAQRETYKQARTQLLQKAKALDKLKVQLEILYKHKLIIHSKRHISNEAKRTYPLFISRNEMTRLRYFLRLRQVHKRKLK